MKKGKLLAAINMMGLAALSAGVAGTFAWYTVSASSNIGVAMNRSSLMTVNNNASGINGGLVNFEVTWTQDSTYDSEHIHFVNDSGEQYVWQNGTLIHATAGDGTNAYGIMTVQLGNCINLTDINNGQATLYENLSEDQKAALAGRYIMRLSPTSNRVHIYSSAPTEHFITEDSTITAEVTIGKTSPVPIENNSVTFYYTVSGEKTNGNTTTPDSNPITFTFELRHSSYVPVVA